MNYDFTQFKPLLARAGITVIEAAKLFKTTRTTIYHWQKGNAPNQEILLAFATRQIELIEKAVVLKRLPLVGVPAKERLPIIRKILKDML